MLGRQVCAHVLHGRGYVSQHVTPVSYPRQIDRHRFELGDAGQPLLDMDRAVVSDSDQSHRLGAAFADVASLRYAGHHHGTASLRDRTLVDMAERPVIEAGCIQIGESTRRIRIVVSRAGHTCVHQSDIDRALKRRVESREQTLRSLRAGEAEAMDGDAELGTRTLDGNGLGTAAEYFHGVRKCELLGDARQSVLIAADNENSGCRPHGACGFPKRDSAPSLIGRLVAVVKITGEAAAHPPARSGRGRPC